MAWTGNLKWSRPLSNDQRKQLLTDLKLDPNTGPPKFWLSEFVDHWPYGVAPGDVYFSRSESQQQVGYHASPRAIDPVFPGTVALGLILPWLRRRQRTGRPSWY
jgi:hypothetical protein